MTEPQRLTALDILRGGTMAFLCLQVLDLPLGVAKFPDSQFWQFVSAQASHAQWEGLTAWDMIQPLFMFMVGISLPWSVAARLKAGQVSRDLWIHALKRSLIFVLLGVMLVSLETSRTEWVFTNVLAQIGLGYPLLFGLALTTRRTQILAAGAILLLVWAVYALWPGGWVREMGPGSGFDRWFLNLLPRSEPLGDQHGYSTLNFIPALVTMQLGAMAGELLRTSRNSHDTLRTLVIASTVILIAGLLLVLTGVCPLIKRIWSPSFVLVTGGLIGYLLAATWWLMDLRGYSKPFELLRIVGMNSLILYLVLHIWDPFIPDQILTHLGWNVLSFLSEDAAEFVARLMTWALLLGFCVWLHRHRVYIKV